MILDGFQYDALWKRYNSAAKISVYPKPIDTDRTEIFRDISLLTQNIFAPNKTRRNMIH